MRAAARARAKWQLLISAAAVACFLCAQLAMLRRHSASAAATQLANTASQCDGTAFVNAVAKCTSFACLRAAHSVPHEGKFNFPHFFIIGYPKCATTSLHAYLEKHPQALGSTPK
ncbi:hypothetical protein Rsub_13373, partial [Raphidocelis subcapitata]